MSKFFIFLINTYQKTPIKSHFSCRFTPTCSEYTKQAILKYGPITGIKKGFLRIIRCHPWQKKYYDPLV